MIRMYLSSRWRARIFDRTWASAILRRGPEAPEGSESELKGILKSFELLDR